MSFCILYNVVTPGTKYIGGISFCLFCNCVCLSVCLSVVNFFTVKDFSATT